MLGVWCKCSFQVSLRQMSTNICNSDVEKKRTIYRAIHNDNKHISCKVIPFPKHSENTPINVPRAHTHTHMALSTWLQYSHHCCCSGSSRVNPAEGEDGCFISTTGMERGRERRTERRERKSQKVGQWENVISHKTNDTSSGRVPCPTALGCCIFSLRDHHHAVFRFVSSKTATPQRLQVTLTVKTGCQACTCWLANTHKHTQTPPSPHCLTWR